MTQPSLLTELAQMPYTARFRTMVDLGRRAANDPATAAFIDTLEQGGFYERSLAVQSCFGSRDQARVLRMAVASSRTLRGMAVPLVALVCDDAQVIDVFDRLPARSRRSLVKTLYTRKRKATIDALLGVLAARSDDELALFLPFGTAAAVAQHLPQARETMSARNWRSLAHGHPSFAIDVMERAARDADDADPRLRWQVNAMLPELAEAQPTRTLDLVRAMLAHFSLSQLHMQRLAERRPVEVVDLLLEQDERASINMSRQARHLRTDQLIALVARHGDTLSGYASQSGTAQPHAGDWFERLAPTQRRDVFQAYATAWRDDDGLLRATVVELLPRPLREAEARRNMALPALATRPNDRLAYAACLPWDEASTVLDGALRSADAETRGAALSAYANATRFQRDHAKDLLLILRARRNEQDPVRLAMLTALSALPPSIWRAEHLVNLTVIVRAALDAADLSDGTALAVERLVLKLVPFHPDWSITTLATIASERGRLRVRLSPDRLSDADVSRLAPALLRVLQAWHAREDDAQLVAVANGLGRRLRVIDGVFDLLEEIVRTTRNAWQADQALGLLAEHKEQRFARLVPQLLGALSGSSTSAFDAILGRQQGDGSWIIRPPVYTYLHRHRQELLTPYLGRRAYKGRWTTGKTRFVLPLYNGFHRWTDEQGRTFAATLRDVAYEPDRDTPSVLQVTRQLAALPAVAPDTLLALASDHRLAVRDAALRALGNVDNTDHVASTLLLALDDDRATVAIYVLRRILLQLPAPRALDLLRQAPLERVTIAKEVVRLVGDLRSEDAYRELLAWDTRDLHRDVRAALLRALWNYLERDETWQVFEHAVDADDETFANVLIRIPTERLSSMAQRRLLGLLARLIEHPSPPVRVAALERCAVVPIADPDRVLFAPLLRALGSPNRDESSAAARAIFANYTGRDADAVAQTIEQLLPNRRTLWTATQVLLGVLPSRRSRLLPTVHAIMRVLQSDRLTSGLQVEIAAASLPVEDITALLQSLAATGHLLPDGTTAVRSIATRVTAEHLRALEATLAASDDPVVRRYGLAVLVGGANGPYGWDDERIERLRVYQRDPAPLVAAAAQFTFPPEDAL